MLLKAILVGLLAAVAGVDMFDGLTHIHRPIVTGPIIGLILGDFQTGLIAGATLELVWAGMVPLAGAQPPNVVIGGIIGTSFAILTHQDPKVAVGIAVPFAIAVQALITLFFTLYSPVMHKMDNLAKNSDTKGIDKLNYIGILILFIAYFIVGFLPIYFGADKAQILVEMLPAFIIEGLKVAGGIMPAVGFAMLLKIMFKWSYVQFFIVGFIAVSYLNLPILAVALIGVSIAAYDYFKEQNEKVVVLSNDEEEDYSDGI